MEWSKFTSLGCMTAVSIYWRDFRKNICTRSTLYGLNYFYWTSLGWIGKPWNHGMCFFLSMLSSKAGQYLVSGRSIILWKAIHQHSHSSGKSCSAGEYSPRSTWWWRILPSCFFCFWELLYKYHVTDQSVAVDRAIHTVESPSKQTLTSVSWNDHLSY